MDAVPGLRVTIQLLPLGMEARAAQADQDEQAAQAALESADAAGEGM